MSPTIIFSDFWAIDDRDVIEEFIGSYILMKENVVIEGNKCSITEMFTHRPEGKARAQA